MNKIRPDKGLNFRSQFIDMFETKLANDGAPDPVRSKRRVFLILFSLFFFVMLACTVPSVNLPELGPPATPTPMGDTLQFNIPIYNVGLQPGGTVPKTRLEYVRELESGVYEMRIDGQTVNKRSGDSFFWNGVISPGVLANFNLRIIIEGLNQLQVTGPVEIFVLNHVPVELATLPVDETFTNYRGIAIDYRMPEGSTIPGTAVIYSGMQEQGGNALAVLTGSTTYSQLAIADSMIYTGQLLNNVYVRYSLRVLSIDENGLRLTGTAELWVK